MTAVLYRVTAKVGSENMEYYIVNVFQVLFLTMFFIEFYLFACFVVYLIKKEKKIVLSLYELKQFLKISKTKIIIAFSFIVLSFVWGIIISVLYRALFNMINFENIEYYINNVFPMLFYILSILKFYLFTCLAVYLSGKNENL